MAFIKKCSEVSVCLDYANRKYIRTGADELIIGYEVDDDGNITNAIKVKDLLNHVQEQDKKVSTIQFKLDETILRLNSLIAAYKANASKTAMQILDIEENN